MGERKNPHPSSSIECSRQLRAYWITVALLAVCTRAGATTISLAPAKDNTLYEDSAGALSNGAGQYLFAGGTNRGDTRRALLAFDVAAVLPPDAQVTSASLILHLSRTVSLSEPISVHRVLSDWGEGTSIAGGQEGAGAPATPGDATWLHTFFPSGQWSATGGDYEANESAALFAGNEGYYTFSTPELTADVQAWASGSSSNFGWMLRGDEGIGRTTKRFDSRENLIAANRPVLSIDYTLAPEPASSFVISMIGLGILHRRRARHAR